MNFLRRRKGKADKRRDGREIPFSPNHQQQPADHAAHPDDSIKLEFEGKDFHSTYLLGDIIHVGAFSEVWSATVRSGPNKGLRVAVKRVDRTDLPREDEEDLLEEVRILRALKHPNVLRIYQFFKDDPEYYFVSVEYMGGGDLFDSIVKKEYFFEKDARDLCRTLMDTVRHLHDLGIVHRDLKPENLLLTSQCDDATVKLVDFGFARNIMNGFVSTQVGTPGYVAPEILRAESYGTSVDMWSVGVIIFILLGGYPPFDDENQTLLFRKIKAGNFEFHPAFWQFVSNEAKDLIRRLLTVDPRRRLTAAQAVTHPWLLSKDANLPKHNLGVNLEQLKLRLASNMSIAADRDVLCVLYGSTGGDSWERKQNWNTALPLEEWHGVEVNEESRVVKLELTQNALRGLIPPELGNLAALEYLYLDGNELSGLVPPELGNLAALKMLSLRGNKLSGGPMEDESLDSWRARLREQHPAEPDERKEEVIVQHSSSPQGGGPAGSSVAPAEGASSPEEEDEERLLQVQLDSVTELKNLTRENREALAGIKKLIGKPTAGGSSYGSEFIDEDKLRELDSLMAMARILDEMALRHMEDKDIQRKELALPPDSKAYYITVRTGLCNAYLAASVVASNLVRTSKTGGMGTAAEALKVLSSAVPVVGGLASFTAAALKAGDRHIQTRRLVKITTMATDANECCALARTVALRLAAGLPAGTIPTTCKLEESRLPAMLPAGGGAGGCVRNQGIGASLPDDAGEEAVMEWFADEVANGESNTSAKNGPSEEQAGSRLGKRHLQELLVAVGRGCLRGTNAPEEKVERLLKVVVPEASGRRPVTTSSAPARMFVQSRVLAPPHGGGLGREGEFAAIAARLDALEADKKRLEGELEAMKKRAHKPQEGPSGAVDAGGGQVLSQEQETSTKEDFWREAEDTAGVAAAADYQPVTHAQLREFAALQDERHREHDDRHREVQHALGGKKDKRGGE